MGDIKEDRQNLPVRSGKGSSDQRRDESAMHEGVGGDTGVKQACRGACGRRTDDGIGHSV